MSLRLAYVLAGALTAIAAPAVAQPEVRDHRTPAPAATGAENANGGVTVTPSSGPRDDGPRRYRRRPGPRVMMPIKLDIGPSMIGTDRGLASGLSAAVGIHWASLSPRPTNTDIGIGVFGAINKAPEDMTVVDDDPVVLQGGAYLELAHTLSHGTWWRTWAAGRGEYMGSRAFDREKTGFGATGRLSVELFLSGVGIEPRGLFLGTYAIGLYVEAGARDTVADVSNFHAGAGLTFRTPLVFAP
jgi:hypothetical protein